MHDGEAWQHVVVPAGNLPDRVAAADALVVGALASSCDGRRRLCRERYRRRGDRALVATSEPFAQGPSGDIVTTTHRDGYLVAAG